MRHGWAPFDDFCFTDHIPRNFIAFLERAFQERGVRCDVLLLSPRLSERAVVRRQIIEGVSAVSKITRANQQTGRIPLQVFDRRGGNDNVRFEGTFQSSSLL